MVASPAGTCLRACRAQGVELVLELELQSARDRFVIDAFAQRVREAAELMKRR